MTDTGRRNGFALIDLIFVCGIIGCWQHRAASADPGEVGSRRGVGDRILRAINSAELTFALTCGAGSTRRA